MAWLLEFGVIGALLGTNTIQEADGCLISQHRTGNVSCHMLMEILRRRYVHSWVCPHVVRMIWWLTSEVSSHVVHDVLQIGRAVNEEKKAGTRGERKARFLLAVLCSYVIFVYLLSHPFFVELDYAANFVDYIYIFGCNDACTAFICVSQNNCYWYLIILIHWFLCLLDCWYLHCLRNVCSHWGISSVWLMSMR